MSEELKVGQSINYTIADKVLTLKPLSLGKMKRATGIFSEKSEDNLEMIARYLLAILDNSDNKELSVEWITENVTMPEANKMIDDSRIINGLGSFFQKGTDIRPTAETPMTKTPEERAINELTPIHLG